MNNNQQGESRVDQLAKVFDDNFDCHTIAHKRETPAMSKEKFIKLVAQFLAASTGAEKEELSISHESAMADDFQVPNNVTLPSSIDVNKEKPEILQGEDKRFSLEEVVKVLKDYRDEHWKLIEPSLMAEDVIKIFKNK